MTGFNAWLSAGLTMNALTPAEIRDRMAWISSEELPLADASMTLETSPEAFACTLTEQPISSRQPLPTMLFARPIAYWVVAAAGVAGAPAANMSAAADAQRNPCVGTRIWIPPVSYFECCRRRLLDYVGRHAQHLDICSGGAGTAACPSARRQGARHRRPSGSAPRPAWRGASSRWRRA